MEKELDPSTIPAPKKGGINPKVLVIGLPVFIVQLVVVYFVTANILLSKKEKDALSADKDKAPVTEVKTSSVQTGPIETIEDLIVNPAGTNGQRLLLTSVGFGLIAEEKEAEDAKKKFEEKKVIIQDVVNTTLAGKTVSELSSISYRDTVKTEILKTLKERVPDIKVGNIFFSKFIIQ
ncbi:MAG TPA: flagellar basal body-associated FliL family protein [Ignavibacteriales bacterium]|nr:flagellar basal body-associated FliL family protein [Ignavibacteriales bacterium]